MIFRAGRNSPPAVINSIESPRAFCSETIKSRSGLIPEPTVKVRMKEDDEDNCAHYFLRLTIIYLLRPEKNTRGGLCLLVLLITAV